MLYAHALSKTLLSIFQEQNILESCDLIKVHSYK